MADTRLVPEPEGMEALRSHQMGSNLSGLITITGLDEFRQKIIQMHNGLSGTIMTKALQAGAQVYKKAIEAAVSPISSHAKVVVVERRRKGFVKEEERSFLIGIDKETGYYLYWREYGHEPAKQGRQWVNKKLNIRVKGGRGKPGSPGKQEKKPFFDQAANSAHAAALAAAEKTIDESVQSIMNR